MMHTSSFGLYMNHDDIIVVLGGLKDYMLKVTSSGKDKIVHLLPVGL